MKSVGRMFWVLNDPLSAFRTVVGRLRYPAYKRHVGPPEMYEALGQHQFELLKSCGLRPSHSLLDVGCGSLRAGQFFIRYLDNGNYAGIEPNGKILYEGIKRNLRGVRIEEKNPAFSNNDQLRLSVFDRKFDFLLAHSILTHAAQHQIEMCFSEARKVMKPSSLLFANYNKGATDYSGTKWIYPGEHRDGDFHGAVTYTFRRISSLAQAAGFQCSELDVVHPTASFWIVLCEPDYFRRLAGRIGPNRFLPVEA
jgi:SAM-dependent methyltransferase